MCSKVMDVFIKAAEYIEIPVRRSDEEPLQKLFVVVRSELNLNPKSLKQDQAKFWKQHPALVKVLALEQYSAKAHYLSFFRIVICPSIELVNLSSFHPTYIESTYDLLSQGIRESNTHLLIALNHSLVLCKLTFIFMKGI